MSEHVMATIAEIEGRIGKLMGLRDGLQAFLEGGGGPEAIRVPAPAAAESAVPVRGMPKVKVKQKETKERKGKVTPAPGSRRQRNGNGKSNEETLRVCGAVLKLGEPFKATEVQNAAKVEYKKASNFLTQGKLKGWVKGVAFGQYMRTAKFPGIGTLVLKGPEAATVPPGRAPTNGKEREKLEAALENARKQVAHAKEQGRSTMVEIFERDVERLEKELGI